MQTKTGLCLQREKEEWAKMTNQEAIEELKIDMDMIRYDPATGEEMTLEDVKRHNSLNYKQYLADEKAITALEKQIPKKPEQVQKLNDGRKIGWCPTCKYSQNYENWNYCKECGQLLDWGDE